MSDVLPFSKCLNHLLTKHQLNSTQIISLIGGRGEWKKLMSESLPFSRLTQYYERIKKAFLFSPEELTELEHALKISQIGSERYIFELSIEQIFSGVQPISKALLLENQSPLSERLAHMQKAERIDILCINCCFPSVIQALIPLFQEDQHIRMKHYFHSCALTSRSAGLISALMPLLFDTRYEPYSIHSLDAASLGTIGGNLLCIDALFSGSNKQMFFVILDDCRAVELNEATNAGLFAFISHLIDLMKPTPQPLKEPEISPDNFSSLCMTFLSHELNRATYSLSNDLCFHQVPSEIAISALRDKAMFSADEINTLIRQTLSIHEQRYQNLYCKKKNAYRIMTIAGCERFLQTGYCMDHFIGFRAFTPKERMQIFGKMIEEAEKKAYYIPLLMKEVQFPFRYSLVCYENLGISIDEKDTDYDISKGYRSTFLMFSEFTQQYQDYYLKTIVREKCYSQEESLSLLKSLYNQFVTKFSLVS